MSLYKRGKIWYVDIEVTGQPRIQRSARTTNKREAERYEAELRLKLEQVKEQGKTLNDALILWLQKKERSSKDKSAIRVFLKTYPNRSLSKIDGHDILDATMGWNPATYNRTANIIRASVNLAYNRNWCNKIEIYRRDVKRKKIRFLSRHEWARLEPELSGHLESIVKYSLYTGVRHQNALRLKWEDVDLENKATWVDGVEAKGKEPISIPLSNEAVEILKKEVGKNSKYVFTYRGKPIKGVRTSWDAALKRAGIENFRWHDLRHTWASWHVQNGTPLAVLKELGGWSDISMVLIYAHLSPEHLRQYADNSNVT